MSKLYNHNFMNAFVIPFLILLWWVLITVLLLILVDAVVAAT